MPAKKRFLKNLDINFISLVDKAANQKVVIFKSADPSKNSHNKIIKIAKVNDEQREVIGVVYEPDTVDTDGDFTTAEEIKKAEQLFMKSRKTTNVDNQHDENPDEGFVAESWIVHKNDARLPDAKEGSWAVVIKVENDETWEKVKSGEITGLSMGGIAVAEEIEKSDKTDTSFLEKITKAIKDGFENIRLKKDFNSAWNQEQLRRMSWALSDSISEILNDEDIEDKKAEILKNVEQFKTAVDNYNFSESVSKNKNKNKEETEMTPEEITQLVKSTIADEAQSIADKVVATVNENIEKMKNEVNEKAGEIEKRLTVVEEASPGSAQDVEVFKSSEDYKGIPWLS